MRREGFSLVEISVVLVIVATMLAGVLPAITESSKVRAIDQTADRMKEIEDSLQAYFAANSALPCPSDITQAVNNANFGKKAANATCQGGTPAANWGPVNAAGGAGDVVGGGVPTKDLGLPDEAAFDGWGHRFAYHVDRTATVAGTFSTSGAITVNGTGGALRSATAVYALISAGKNGHGGYGRAATRFDAGSTNADEWSNCQSVAATCGGAPASYNATFVQRLEQADSAVATNKFDDLVVYKLTGHLLAGGPGALWAPSGANIYNTNSGNVGVGTTAPTQKLDVAGAIAGQSATGAGDVLFIGNDTKLTDINIANITGLYGIPDPTIGGLKLGSGGGTLFGYNGNIGIGTTAPFRKLHVVGGNVPFLASTSDYNNVNAGSMFSVEFGAASGNTYSSLNALSAGGTAWNNLILQPAGTAGNVGIGTVTPSNKLQVYGNVAGNYVAVFNNAGTHGAWGSGTSYGLVGTAGAGGIGVLGVSAGNGVYGQVNPANASVYGVYAENGSNNAGLARSDGYSIVGTGTAWFSGTAYPSDGRLKENVTAMGDNLGKVLEMRPVHYTWKPDSEQGRLVGDKAQTGLIAQEIEAIAPEVVTTMKILSMPSLTSAAIPGPDGKLTPATPPQKPNLNEQLGETKGIDYSKLVPYLIGAVQELNAKVESGHGKSVPKRVAASPSAVDAGPKKWDGQMIFNVLMGLGLSWVVLYVTGAKRPS